MNTEPRQIEASEEVPPALPEPESGSEENPTGLTAFFNRRPFAKKSVISLVFIVLAIVARLGVVDKALGYTPTAAFEASASTYLADIQKRAFVSFMAARGVSAIIEGLKTAEFSVVAVSIRPGQALEPINDLVDEFSTVMLVSLAAVGTQELILRIGTATGFILFLPVGFLVYAWRPWADKSKQQNWRKLGSGILVLAVFIRFFIPVVAGVGQHVTNTYLIEDYRLAMENVSGVENKLQKLHKDTEKQVQDKPTNSESQPKKTGASKAMTRDSGGLAGFVAAMGRLAGKTVDSINQAFTLPDMEKLGALLSELMDDIVTLIKIFVFETMVLPLIAGYILLLALRALFRIPA